VTEQTPPPDSGAADTDRIGRLRARASQPDATSGPEPDPSPTAPPDVAAAAPAPPTPPTAAAADNPPTPPAAAGPYVAPSARAGWVATPAVAAVTVLAVLAAAAVALAALVTSHVSSVNAVDRTRGDVVGAATSGVATVLSYDYRHLDADFTKAQRLLTRRFRKQYDDTTAKGVRPLATKYKAISSADVSAAGVVEAGRDRAVVLVFVNQTVTNSQLTAPRLDRSRIDVTLVRSNGRWLIDKLTTL
jgi:Mce-associated membrane protein